ncbi:MAG: amidohydrolase [Elusimicrobia bacterium]|nr:amidohydrolase [Elusimicrobiota bacterium]
MRRSPAALLALLVAGCAALKGPEPAALIIAGPVYGRPGAEGVLIRGARVAAVGLLGDLALAAPAARRLDTGGGLILPGFSDSHLHLLDGGLSLEKLDLRPAKSEAEAAEAVRLWAESHPGTSTVWGLGWSYDIVSSGTTPSAAALDAVVPGRPVVLESYDGHAYWLNGAALARAGASDSGGTLIEPDGRLIARAGGSPSRAEKVRAMKAALAHLARLGVTSASAVSAGREDFDILRELEERGELTLRVFYSPSIHGDLTEYERLRARATGPLLHFGWLKGFVDGVIESKTAAMLEPYAGSAERGAPAEDIAALVASAQRRGFSAALHAVGDAAVRAGLDAFAAADRVAPRPQRRRRLEHLEVVDPADLPRFKDLDAVASMQPLHALPDGPEGEGAWARNLGPERRARAFGWRALRDAGAPLAFGSDWTVASPDPLAGLAAALGPLRPDEAVGAYTAGPAYAAGLEGVLGCLDPGCLADMVVLDPAVRLDEAASLRAGRVRAAVVGGRVVMNMLESPQRGTE